MGAVNPLSLHLQTNFPIDIKRSGHNPNPYGKRFANQVTTRLYTSEYIVPGGFSSNRLHESQDKGTTRKGYWLY